LATAFGAAAYFLYSNGVFAGSDDGAAGGGLILCSSNSLHQGVNPENCMAMFKAGRKHGQYQ